MIEFNWFGKTLIFFGAALMLIGSIFLLAGRIHWIGRLPGDIIVHKKNFIFFFPIATSILVSVVLSVIFYFLGKR